jgi:alkyl hydroperoxide reductase subunit F
MERDLIIIGGGPAGVAAGVYASRKQLKTALITEAWGGQSIDSLEIQNWIGTGAISGIDLADSLKKHLEKYKGDFVEVTDGTRATKLEKIDGGFRVTTDANKTFDARAVLIASGGHRRKLEVTGAEQFENKGVTYCASCDGPLFGGADVAVIGGGNAAFETAAQLLAYAKSVTLFNRSDVFKADPITVKKVSEHPNMKVITNADPALIKGDQFVSSFSYTDKTTGDLKEIAVSGIFVEIGMIPNTEYAEGVVPMDEFKRIITDPKNQQTKTQGVWAAGDCTDELYHQNNIAAGDGVKALEDIYMYLRAR